MLDLVKMWEGKKCNLENEEEFVGVQFLLFSSKFDFTRVLRSFYHKQEINITCTMTCDMINLTGEIGHLLYIY